MSLKHLHSIKQEIEDEIDMTNSNTVSDRGLIQYKPVYSQLSTSMNEDIKTETEQGESATIKHEDKNEIELCNFESVIISDTGVLKSQHVHSPLSSSLDIADVKNEATQSESVMEGNDESNKEVQEDDQTYLQGQLLTSVDLPDYQNGTEERYFSAIYQTKRIETMSTPPDDSSTKDQQIGVQIEDETLKCKICLAQFTQKCFVDRHIKVHTGSKSFKCEMCSKQFYRQQHLDKHLRTHTGEKPYECEICFKLFARRDALRVHSRTHTGEKPYKCEICSKCFNQKRNLTDHVILHTGVKAYVCEVCFKRFPHARDLNMHVKTHLGEKHDKCEICFKLFSRTRDLKRHVRIHTGEKPYKCNVCSKLYTRADALRIHSKIHTGEQP